MSQKSHRFPSSPHSTTPPLRHQPPPSPHFSNHERSPRRPLPSHKARYSHQLPPRVLLLPSSCHPEPGPFLDGGEGSALRLFSRSFCISTEHKRRAGTSTVPNCTDFPAGVL